jgi:peptidoglycan/xylan/chitin deacetylase (PgdA/CDA1 family)
MIERLQPHTDLWDLYTRKEEYQPLFLDKYKRFLQCQTQNREIMVPRVSEFLARTAPPLEFPEGKEFGVCLTHDIDLVYESLPNKLIGHLVALKNGDIPGARRYLVQMRSKALPWQNIEEILALEERYGASSTFFVMALNRGEEDAKYDVKDLEHQMGAVLDAGSEVGLHGGHQAYASAAKMREEKARLEQVIGRPVAGYRNHFLRFIVPDTWHYLHDAGFAYDSTLGFAGCIGFRNGMCHPFRPFDLRAGREIEILEIPLAIMDGTLFEYMNLDEQTAWTLTRQLIDRVKTCHGIVTVLFHNTYLTGDRARFYQKILEYCSGQKGWMSSARGIAEWWQRQSW